MDVCPRRSLFKVGHWVTARLQSLVNKLIGFRYGLPWTADKALLHDSPLFREPMALLLAQAPDFKFFNPFLAGIQDGFRAPCISLAVDHSIVFGTELRTKLVCE